MARFTGSYQETFVLDVPIETARAHFSSLDAIVANYGPILTVDRIGDDTLKFVLQEKNDKGVRYQGRYTCKYTLESDTRFTWRTLSDDNMWSTGSIDFRDLGGRTELRYQQTMDTEIKVPRLFAAVAKGIVSREIAEGIRAYLGRMKGACPSAG